jgi:DNA polymerase III, subunit gamma and tau
MAYVALYRKWRPQGFDALVGQDPIRRTLKNSVAAGRISHAFLFTGPRGTGKTSTAKILAKALNCQNRREDGEPCGSCSNCMGIQDGSSMDVFEIDAASNRGIDQIRDLREAVKFAPTEGAYKVYIIDEVHMVTTDAFNAFLKTLEEPPSHVVFILATTEPQKIPATILSRCQRYDFRRIAVQDIIERLEEIMADSGFSAEPGALQLIAVRAEGGLRDALSILDQAVTMAEGPVTEALVRDLLGLVGQEAMATLVDSFIEKDMGKALIQVEALRQAGQEPRQTFNQLLEYLRLLVLYFGAPTLVKEQVTSEEWQVLKRQSEEGNEKIFRQWLDTFLQESSQLRVGADARLHLEMAIAKALKGESGAGSGNTAQLVEEIRRLEKRIQELEKGGRPIASAPVQPQAPVKEPIKVPAAPAKEAVTAPIENIEKPRLSAESIQSDPPKPASSESMQKSEPVTEAQIAPTGNEGEVWEQVLGLLEVQNKRAVKACAMQGKLVSIAGGKATVSFVQSFSGDRLSRPDFKKIIEELLEQIVGSAVSLVCTSGSSIAAPGAPVVENSTITPKEASTALPEESKVEPKKETPKKPERQSIKPDEAPVEVKSALAAFGIEEADIFLE